jgi:hypothetical protein
VLASSERYKTEIETMGAASNRLQELRPVTFKLKTDPEGAIQYGLIAEEVAKVYPELVIRNPKGEIQGVRYEELAPMLLSEMQHERTETREKLQALSDENAALAAKIRGLEQTVAEVTDLKHELAEMRTLLAELQSNDQLVARR